VDGEKKGGEEGGVADAMMRMAMPLDPRWSQRGLIGSAAYDDCFKAKRLTLDADST
jgi:hypothetical protein